MGSRTFELGVLELSKGLGVNDMIDVLVLGARPSGSIVVRICAIMGFSTVLLEK